MVFQVVMAFVMYQVCAWKTGKQAGKWLDTEKFNVLFFFTLVLILHMQFSQYSVVYHVMYQVYMQGG